MNICQEHKNLCYTFNAKSQRINNAPEAVFSLVNPKCSNVDIIILRMVINNYSSKDGIISDFHRGSEIFLRNLPYVKGYPLNFGCDNISEGKFYYSPIPMSQINNPFVLYRRICPPLNSSVVDPATLGGNIIPPGYQFVITLQSLDKGNIDVSINMVWIETKACPI